MKLRNGKFDGESRGTDDETYYCVNGKREGIYHRLSEHKTKHQFRREIKYFNVNDKQEGVYREKTIDYRLDIFDTIICDFVDDKEENIFIMHENPNDDKTYEISDLIAGQLERHTEYRLDDFDPKTKYMKLFVDRKVKIEYTCFGIKTQMIKYDKDKKIIKGYKYHSNGQIDTIHYYTDEKQDLFLYSHLGKCMDDDCECSICGCKGKERMILSCHHCVHRSCLSRWFIHSKQYNNLYCPYCSQLIDWKKTKRVKS